MQWIVLLCVLATVVSQPVPWTVYINATNDFKIHESCPIETSRCTSIDHCDTKPKSPRACNVMPYIEGVISTPELHKEINYDIRICDGQSHLNDIVCDKLSSLSQPTWNRTCICADKHCVNWRCFTLVGDTLCNPLPQADTIRVNTVVGTFTLDNRCNLAQMRVHDEVCSCTEFIKRSSSINSCIKWKCDYTTVPLTEFTSFDIHQSQFTIHHECSVFALNGLCRTMTSKFSTVYTVIVSRSTCIRAQNRSAECHTWNTTTVTHKAIVNTDPINIVVSSIFIAWTFIGTMFPAVYLVTVAFRPCVCCFIASLYVYVITHIDMISSLYYCYRITQIGIQRAYAHGVDLDVS